MPCFATNLVAMGVKQLWSETMNPKKSASSKFISPGHFVKQQEQMTMEEQHHSLLVFGSAHSDRSDGRRSLFWRTV